ncbi:MAG TPA: GldG family protein [Woeseiaceae bacterium]|nr:GldG family protein [Woeseiaceae bacterium]
MLVKNKNSFTVYMSVLVGVLLLLNLIGRNWYKRFDLTDNKMYSLSKSSENVVEKIDDLLTMKVYFSDDLPGELSNTQRFLQDLLEEYEAKSDNIRFFFTNPESNDQLEEEARKDGIQPVQMQVVEDDKLEIKRVYLGMVLLYEDKKETIPVIQTATGLEYLITTKIKTLVNTDKKTIGIANLSKSIDIKTENLSNQLRQHHITRPVELSNEGLIDESIDVLLVSGATDTLDSVTVSNLSSFLDSGRGVFFAQGGVTTDMQTQQASVINSNVFTFLNSYGLNVNQNLVLDKSCGRVQVQQQMGFIRMNVPMDYPFLPVVKNFNEQELVVSGLEQIHLFFPSEIVLDTALNQNVAGVIDLFKSSNKSGIMSGRYILSPDPKNNPFLQNLNQRSKVLGASSRLVSGGELIVVADSKFLSDDAGMSVPENMVFLMNAVDYLAGEKELISLRSREITNRPLDEIEDGTRTRWKWANVLLPSLLIAGFGMYRSKREKDKAEILKQIYE